MALDISALSVEPEPLTPHRQLLDAAKTIAEIAEPNLDLRLSRYAILEVVRELQSTAIALDTDVDRAYEAYDAAVESVGYQSPALGIAYAMRTIALKQARNTAVRSCKRQLIKLAVLINQMETS